MPKIFICYRRDDSPYSVQRIHEDLKKHFGDGSVVFDIDTVPYGVDFRKYLSYQVSSCDIMLAVIGDRWLDILKERTDDPGDHVRLEIEAALAREIPVVPVLTDKASMPREEHLPAKLGALAYRQAAEVRAGAELNFHVERLIQGLEPLLREQEAARKTAEKSYELESEIARKEKVQRRQKSVDPKEKSEATLRRLKDGAIFYDRLKDGYSGPEMLVLPTGEFMMGSPDDDQEALAYEKPQHSVKIDYHLAVGRYLVTFEQYDRFADATDREKPHDNGWDRGRRPVINVSWDDAETYAAWLSKETERAYRLLSEAEWEYAARATTRSRYSFGDEISEEDANFGANVGKTTEVGTYPANPWVLHDLHGNVWEWVEDYWNESYEGAPSDGSAWASGDYSRHVLRGGSWTYASENLRSASREWSNSGRGNDIGFRVARTLP